MGLVDGHAQYLKMKSFRINSPSLVLGILLTLNPEKAFQHRAALCITVSKVREAVAVPSTILHRENLGGLKILSQVAKHVTVVPFSKPR